MKAALDRVVWARQTTDCLNLIGSEPVGMGDMNPGNFLHMPGNVPPFEPPNYRQDIALVLRAILAQNQKLAQEVARLRQQVEGGSGGRGGTRVSAGIDVKRLVQQGAHQERFRALEALSVQGS